MVETFFFPTRHFVKKTQKKGIKYIDFCTFCGKTTDKIQFLLELQTYLGSFGKVYSVDILKP